MADTASNPSSSSPLSVSLVLLESRQRQLLHGVTSFGCKCVSRPELKVSSATTPGHYYCNGGTEGAEDLGYRGNSGKLQGRWGWISFPLFLMNSGDDVIGAQRYSFASYKISQRSCVLSPKTRRAMISRLWTQSAAGKPHHSAQVPLTGASFLFQFPDGQTSPFSPGNDPVFCSPRWLLSLLSGPSPIILHPWLWLFTHIALPAGFQRTAGWQEAPAGNEKIRRKGQGISSCFTGVWPWLWSFIAEEAIWVVQQSL